MAKPIPFGKSLRYLSSRNFQIGRVGPSKGEGITLPANWLAISLISLAFFGVFFSSTMTKHDRMKLDVPSFYAYLPSIFIYNDIKLNYINKNPDFFADKIWYYTTNSNERVIKHTIGFSLFLSPFFLAGHLISLLTNSPSHGYTLIYQNALSIGIFLYLISGMFLLGNVLKKYFKENISAITLLILFFGTNLFWYTTFEGLMSHALVFFLVSLNIYLFLKYDETPKEKYLYLFSLFFGLMVLTRPILLVSILFFGALALSSNNGFKKLIQPKISSAKNFLISFFLFLTGILPQIIYWKISTGSWIFNPYNEEGFILWDPHFWSLIFGFRKGLFIYSPLLLLIIPGFVFMFYDKKNLLIALLLITSTSFYLISCWWVSSSGPSWGNRYLIDFFPFIAFPFSQGIQALISRKLFIKVFSSLVIALLLILNLFQTWQYKNGLIHFDDMTRESYMSGFLQTKQKENWGSLLRPFDWNRRLKGRSQIKYSKVHFSNIGNKEIINIRSSLGTYLLMNELKPYAIASQLSLPNKYADLNVVHIKGNMICIRAHNGNYFKIDEQNQKAITASAKQIEEATRFLIEFPDPYDNQVHLKEKNGDYLGIVNEFPYLLKAGFKTPSYLQTFRYYCFVKD